MHAFDVLGDPVRRRLLELLADHERSSGDMTAMTGLNSSTAGALLTRFANMRLPTNITRSAMPRVSNCLPMGLLPW